MYVYITCLNSRIMKKLLSRFQGQSSSGSPQLKFVISEKEQYLLPCRDNFKLKLLSHLELDMFLEMEALTLCKILKLINSSSIQYFINYSSNNFYILM